MTAYKRGKKWWVNIGFAKQRYRYASPENSFRGALAYEATLRGKLAKGELLKNEPQIKAIAQAGTTFAEFSRQWFKTYVKSNNKYSEQLNKESIFRAHLLPYFGNKPISQIKSLDIENFKAFKKKAGLKNKTINNSLIALSKCLKTAKSWNIIESSPEVKLLKVEPQRFDFLTEDESTTLINHCDGLIKDMVTVAIFTGLRFGELIALDWSDVDFQERVITVRRSITSGRIGSTKSNKIREIPMTNEVYEVLAVKQKKQGFVFTKEQNRPLSPVSCLKWLHKACAKADIRNVGWHNLRHSFASSLARQNVPVISTKEIMGHSDIRTTLRYSHINLAAKREAIAMLNKKDVTLTSQPIITKQEIVVYCS